MKYFTYSEDQSRMQDLEVNERPRERIREMGTKNMSDEELVSILLGSGSKQYPVRQISRNLMQYLDGTQEPEIREMERIGGVGPAKASIIAAAIELGRRRLPIRRKKICTPDDVYSALRHYGTREQENFIMLLLNGAHEIISHYVVAIGTVNRCQVTPRDCFRKAVELNACCVISAHNHPSCADNSEMPLPSKEDLELHKRLKACSEILGIPIIDNMILGGEKYFSFIENNIF